MPQLLLVLPYAAIDRLWGSDVRHARTISVVALPAAGYALDGLHGACVALAFLVVRSLPFLLLGGSATPVTARQHVGLLLRYAFMVVLAAACAVAFDRDAIGASIAWGLWAVAATGLSSWYGRRNAEAIASGRPIDPRDNVWVEALRGALAGIAASAS